MNWEKNKNKYSTGENLVVGKVIVGGWHYDAFVKRGEAHKYVIHTNLPSFKPKQNRYEKLEEAKESLENFTQRWFGVYAKEQQVAQQEARE